jgi:hypothetical protein
VVQACLDTLPGLRINIKPNEACPWFLIVRSSLGQQNYLSLVDGGEADRGVVGLEVNAGDALQEIYCDVAGMIL